MRVKTLAVAVILVLVGCAMVLAQPKRDQFRMKQELKLTDQQEKKLQELYFNTAKELIQMRSDLQIARLDLKRMLAEEEPDREMIFNQVEQISKIQAEMKKVHIEKMLAFREILNKEQLEKFRELQQERRMHFREMKRKFKGPDRHFPGQLGMLPEDEADSEQLEVPEGSQTPF